MRIVRFLLKVAVRLLAPTNFVGAVVAVFDDADRVLIVEHVYRTDFAWGLPGGWVKRAESPADAVVREVREELQLEIELKALVLASIVPSSPMANHPPHLGLAYYARSKGQPTIKSGEILGFKFVDHLHIDEELAPFQREAIAAASAVLIRSDRR